jgi:hypothetical protein
MHPELMSKHGHARCKLGLDYNLASDQAAYFLLPCLTGGMQVDETPAGEGGPGRASAGPAALAAAGRLRQGRQVRQGISCELVQVSEGRVGMYCSIIPKPRRLLYARAGDLKARVGPAKLGNL